jgi:hypothetical protein
VLYLVYKHQLNDELINPAAISYIKLETEVGSSLISSASTDMERKIAKITNFRNYN